MNANLRDMASWAEQTVQGIVALTGIACDADFAKQLASEHAYLTPGDWEDFGQAVLLDILECRERGDTLDAADLKRLLHRVREQIRRQTRRIQQSDQFRIENASVRNQFPAAELVLLDTLSPEEALIVEMMCDGFEPIAIAKEFHVSVGTVYRRLRAIRQKLQPTPDS